MDFGVVLSLRFCAIAPTDDYVAYIVDGPTADALYGVVTAVRVVRTPCRFVAALDLDDWIERLGVMAPGSTVALITSHRSTRVSRP